MIIFHKEDICLRTLNIEDATLLVKWLSDPTVLEYYEGRDRPHDWELVKKHFYEDRDGITQCIIEYKNKEIGYLQFYIVDEEELVAYDLNDYKGIIYGMDQFIGEPTYWNRGIGTTIIQETVNYLIKNKQAKKIIMDPQSWNLRALSVYEKIGFKKKKLLVKHEWHEGEYRDCWLVEYEAQPLSEEYAFLHFG